MTAYNHSPNGLPLILRARICKKMVIFARNLKKTLRMEKKYKITVAGTGYVGLSIATLLSQHHNVVAVDVIKER